MAFFGYISSLVVAVMLAVFYIGNVTQYVFAQISKSKEVKEVYVSETPQALSSSVSYYLYEIKTSKAKQGDYVTQSLALANNTHPPLRYLPPPHYPVTDTDNLSQSVYTPSLFLRPPPTAG